MHNLFSGCSNGYNLSQYPQFNDLNTQVAEQRNSFLVKLKPMLSYMNLDNFISHCRFFCYFRNMLLLSVLDPNSTLQHIQMFVHLAKFYCRGQTKLLKL